MQGPASTQGDEGNRTLEELSMSGDEQSGVRRMSLEKVETIVERVFAEHADLFRRLAQ